MLNTESGFEEDEADEGMTGSGSDEISGAVGSCKVACCAIGGC